MTCPVTPGTTILSWMTRRVTDRNVALVEAGIHRFFFMYLLHPAMLSLLRNLNRKDVMSSSLNIVNTESLLNVACFEKNLLRSLRQGCDSMLSGQWQGLIHHSQSESG